VAQAQLRWGLCELKLGHKPQAISALERLTRDFPDKNTLLALVEPHMPQLLDDILTQIEQNYIKEVDRTEMMEIALRAIVGKLDSAGGLLRPDDTAFLGTNEVADLTLNLEQKLGGIGTVLKPDQTNHEIIVTTVLPTSPALKADCRMATG
jgi:carboxyl-terminal processing protease